MDDAHTSTESEMPMAQVLAHPGMFAVKVDLEPTGQIIAVTEHYAFLRFADDEQPAVVPWHAIALRGIEPAPVALPQDVITRDRQDKLAEALRHLLMIENATSQDRATIHQLWDELLAPGRDPLDAEQRDRAQR